MESKGNHNRGSDRRAWLNRVRAVAKMFGKAFGWAIGVLLIGTCAYFLGKTGPVMVHGTGMGNTGHGAAVALTLALTAVGLAVGSVGDILSTLAVTGKEVLELRWRGPNTRQVWAPAFFAALVGLAVGIVPYARPATPPVPRDSETTVGPIEVEFPSKILQSTEPPLFAIPIFFDVAKDCGARPEAGCAKGTSIPAAQREWLKRLASALASCVGGAGEEVRIEVRGSTDGNPFASGLAWGDLELAQVRRGGVVKEVKDAFKAEGVADSLKIIPPREPQAYEAMMASRVLFDRGGKIAGQINRRATLLVWSAGRCSPWATTSPEPLPTANWRLVADSPETQEPQTAQSSDQVAERRGKQGAALAGVMP